MTDRGNHLNSMNIKWIFNNSQGNWKWLFELAWEIGRGIGYSELQMWPNVHAEKYKSLPTFYSESMTLFKYFSFEENTFL